MTITAITTRPRPVTMRQPFVTARGAKTRSANLLVTVQLSTGDRGVGEASASLAWPENTPAAMRRCLARVRAQVVGQTPAEGWRRLRDDWDAPWARPAALSAVECALAGAQARAAGMPLWRWLAQSFGQRPARPRAVLTSMTISAWPPAVAARAAHDAAARGFRQLKIKVTGARPEEDLARLVAVAHAAPRAALIVDANQGFSTVGALAFARGMRLLNLPVALFEQPVARDNLDGMTQLTREAGVPIVADESVCTPADARHVIRHRAAHVLNVKLAKSGLQGARQIIRLARRARRPLMIGCMAESAVGLTPSVHLACGTGAFRYVDLDSHLLARGPYRRSVRRRALGRAAGPAYRQAGGSAEFRTRGPQISVA